MSWLWNDPVGFLVLILGFIGGYWFGYWWVREVIASIRWHRAFRAWNKSFEAMRIKTQDDLYGNLGPEVAELAPQIAKHTSEIDRINNDGKERW